MTEEPNKNLGSEETAEQKSAAEKKLQEEEKAMRDSGFYLRRFLSSTYQFIRRRLSIIDNADPKATIEGIESDVEFRGFNLWILILSIFICSIGLSLDSTAVIIGAMLISPLMGPIMGVGLSIGINDIELLKRSLRNWGVAVGMALVASVLYFTVAPSFGESSELLARTRPNLLDVLIATFGGLAGILAGSRRAKSNVVPGVAIATALMPPLCTAGFSIATGNFVHFAGAMYLFLINSIFISLSTTLVVRYLRFPVRRLPDPKRERRVRRLIISILIIFITPSGYVLYTSVGNVIETQAINQFIEQEIHVDGAIMMEPEIVRDGSETTVNLTFIGEEASDELINNWERKLEQHELDHVRLNIMQVKDNDVFNNGEEMQRIASAMIETQRTLEGKDREINRLRMKLDKTLESGLPPDLMETIRIYNPELAEIYAGQLQLSTASQDTICMLLIKFDETQELNEEKQVLIKSRLAQYVKTRLESDTVFITEL